MELTSIRAAWLQQLQQHRAIAVIRAPSLDLGYSVAAAAAAGGMRLLEVSWTTPSAAQLIEKLRADFPHCQIGAGTLLSEDVLHRAVDAGAQFLFSPHTSAALIQAACRRQRPMVPGALSPSEAVAAWQAGASSVKIFPVSTMGGAAYIHALRGPLGHIPLVPTGGVTLELAPALLAAGAVAVGLSTALFPKAALEAADWDAIAQGAAALTTRIEGYMSRKPLGHD
ncbi:MAG: bifunctional 4-hydroxy-2-oxoglutarate aldolase/2-dehydro-3-deoxy-phosphogluconate aldolase [Elainellaceae cyanobacterium]